MKGFWFAIVVGSIGLTGCSSTPNREMRQPLVEEFSVPPAKYDAPPEYPRDDRGLVPKQSGAPMNLSGIGQQSPGVPGGPGGPGGMSSRR